MLRAPLDFGYGKYNIWIKLQPSYLTYPESAHAAANKEFRHGRLISLGFPLP
ncbi:MAG: hypothetical protein JWO52_5301 [Gammaproteobacteria bacterium]|nr:hypothetical protein [Gammaproteobacteria bacterium]